MAARDIIRRARTTLHERLKIAALYYPGANAPPVPISVRVIDKVALTNAATSRYGLPFNEDQQPQLVFMMSEMDPQTGAVVALEVDEVYRIMATDPPHDITVTANCIRLSLEDCPAYPPPGALP